MRVLRIETDDYVDGRASCAHSLRPNRYGAFSTRYINRDLLYLIPYPGDEFRSYGFEPYEWQDHFYAFPPDKFFEIIPQISDANVYVAEYEVNPELSSCNQVIFSKYNAQFVSECRLCELLS